MVARPDGLLDELVAPGDPGGSPDGRRPGGPGDPGGDAGGPPPGRPPSRPTAARGARPRHRSRRARARAFWATALVAPWVLTAVVCLLRWPADRVTHTGLVVTRAEATWLAAWVLCLLSVSLSGVVRRVRADPDPAAAEPTDRGPGATGDLLGTAAADLRWAARNALERRSGLRGLIVGRDGRVSTSKVQAALWTFVLLYAFVYLLLAGWHVWTRPDSPHLTALVDGFDTLVHHPLQSEYLVVLGFPVGTAVAAKALVTGRIASGDLVKTPTSRSGVAAGVTETVTDDTGGVDLLDLQYTAFGLLTIVYFLARFLGTTVHRLGVGLPDLPPTLLALSGVSTAAYVAKKSLERGTAPQLLRAVPSLVVLGVTTEVTLTGRGFCTGTGPTTFNTVTVGGVDVPVVPGSWTDTGVRLALPPDEAAAAALGLSRGLQDVVVTDDEGNASAALTVHVVARSDLPPG